MEQILKEIREFYLKRFQEHGATGQGMAWKNDAASKMRHEVLLESVLPQHRNGAKVHEVGCGVGHLQDLITEKALPFEYSGSDSSSEVLAKAKERHPRCRFFSFNLLADPIPDFRADYVVNSGAFNFLPPSAGYERWEALVFSSIEKIWRMADKGIAFNLFTDRVDFRDPDLFYINPSKVLARVEKMTRRFVLRKEYDPFDYAVFAYKE